MRVVCVTTASGHEPSAKHAILILLGKLSQAAVRGLKHGTQAHLIGPKVSVSNLGNWVN